MARKPLHLTKAGWTPVHRGPLYCSPCCGFGCTWEEYRTARRHARELVKALGPGWTSRIWENGRWHYSAQKGRCELIPHHRYEEGERDGRRGIPVVTGYTAYFNARTRQFIGEHPSDPALAVEAASNAALEGVDALARDVAELLT